MTLKKQRQECDSIQAFPYVNNRNSCVSNDSYTQYTSIRIRQPDQRTPIVAFTRTVPAIMAENPPPNAGAGAADAAADAVAKLHLDEVTGEMISKSELKKRQKNRQKEADKKEKADKLAASGAPVPKPKSTEDSEKDLTPNQVFSFRSAYKMARECWLIIGLVLRDSIPCCRCSACPGQGVPSQGRLPPTTNSYLGTDSCCSTTLPTISETSRRSSLTSRMARAIRPR